MRDLIDREELRVALLDADESWAPWRQLKDLVKSLPAASCGECESMKRWRLDDEPLMYCDHPQSPFLQCDVTPDFGCALFGRRQ